MQKTMAPDKPFFVYYATAAGHAPQQATPEWIAKYKGKFDQGWDKMREETFARQKQMGIIPADAKLTPRPKEMPSWDSASPREKKVYAAMMELAAAHVAQADYNLGRVLKAIDDLGQTDNTLVIFIVGDNGGSWRRLAAGRLQRHEHRQSKRRRPSTTSRAACPTSAPGSRPTCTRCPGPGR